MEVKNETTNATSGGIQTATSIPAVEKNMNIPPVKKELVRYHEKIYIRDGIYYKHRSQEFLYSARREDGGFFRSCPQNNCT
jgi:hypothetical protein